MNDVTGDIDVQSRTGDMIVMLPDPGPYSIDARTKLGSVSSDFVGKAARQLLVGSQFALPNQAPSRRIYLRMGCGSIEIKNGRAFRSFLEKLKRPLKEQICGYPFTNIYTGTVLAPHGLGGCPGRGRSFLEE